MEDAGLLFFRMEERSRPSAAYDLQVLVADIAAKGWMNTDLARAAGISDKTVSRFLTREHQTAKTIARIAKALGYSVRRYLIRSTSGAA
jgi:lambda repressor-like predicted transcriptional regulator